MKTLSKPKTLYIINHLDWFWSHRLPLAQGAQDQGWDVYVAATGAQNDKKLQGSGFTGRALPASDQGFMPFTLLKTIWAIYKLLNDERPTLIHAITLKYVFLAGLAIRLYGRDIQIIHTVAGLGYLFSGEGLKPRLLRFLIAPFLKLALKHKNAQIIFQNPDDQELLIKRGFVRADQCHLIRGSGVDLQQFSMTREPTTDKDAPPLVIMPTRLVHDKGIAVFIEAAHILKQSGIEARFQIAGGVTANNPLAISKIQMEEMIAQRDHAVEWLGKVSDMPDLLRGSTLVVYPSYYREGIPKVLLEAASMGKAIITTDHTGCREAVTHGVNGLLVPVKDAMATAQAIETLLNDPEKRLKMGQESRARAEKEFDVALIVAQTLQLYKRR